MTLRRPACSKLSNMSKRSRGESAASTPPPSLIQSRWSICKRRLGDELVVVALRVGLTGREAEPDLEGAVDLVGDAERLVAVHQTADEQAAAVEDRGPQDLRRRAPPA